MFPLLSQVFLRKSGVVQDFVCWNEDRSLTWDLSLPRRIPDRAIFEVQQFLELTKDFELLDDVDSLTWFDGDSLMLVKVCYIKLL